MVPRKNSKQAATNIERATSADVRWYVKDHNVFQIKTWRLLVEKKSSTVHKMSTMQIPTIKNRLDDDSYKGCCLYADAHVQLVGSNEGREVLEGGGCKDVQMEEI